MKNRRCKSHLERKSFGKKIKEFEARLSAAAANLGIKHPIPPHLKYFYPPPSASIIANIVQTLVAVPKFYTQVLHLMNKMNLPTPFGTLKTLPSQYAEVLKLTGFYSEKDQMNSDAAELQERLQGNKEDEEYKSSEGDASETESELESDRDEFPEKRKPSVAVKRKLKPSRIINKRPNFSLLKQTCVPHPRLSTPSVGEVFENVDNRQSKRLELKLKGTLPTETMSDAKKEDHEPGGFGKIEAAIEPKDKTVDDLVEWKGESSKYISKEELQNNRINKADWAILPVFKNYQQGEPTVKLYIKNLAKTTTEADLKHIYGRYVFWHNEEEVSMFSIRLMKEGRMKGQAFVTFPSADKASEALMDTNGYILNDKPMVVAFGKVKATS